MNKDAKNPAVEADKEIEALKAKLVEKEAEIEKMKEAEAKAPKPNGIKMSIAVKDYKGEGKFPVEGSDGKGNLIKFAANQDIAKDLEAQGWKKAK
jgi:hypothetical protein